MAVPVPGYGASSDRSDSPALRGRRRKCTTGLGKSDSIQFAKNDSLEAISFAGTRGGAAAAAGAEELIGGGPLDPLADPAAVATLVVGGVAACMHAYQSFTSGGKGHAQHRAIWRVLEGIRLLFPG